MMCERRTHFWYEADPSALRFTFLPVGISSSAKLKVSCLKFVWVFVEKLGTLFRNEVLLRRRVLVWLES